MPFGYRKKGEEEEEQRRLRPIATNVTDKEDLEETNKISNMLNPNEEVFVVARQSRLKPGGSKFTPNIVYATDRRIIIRDPRMLGLREKVVDIPYDLISSVRLDKGVFSSSVIFTAPGLRSSGRLRLIEKMAGTEFSPNEDAVITAIPKDRAEDLVEVIRNGMDRQREVYQQQPQRINVSTNNNNNNNDNSPTISIADELTKLAKLKEQGVISESEFQQMKQDLLKKT
jgi:PH (Pleckstrin Homology) domain-containing protein/putative oligomerization/nucleic acid binding protein